MSKYRGAHKPRALRRAWQGLCFAPQANPLQLLLGSPTRPKSQMWVTTSPFQNFACDAFQSGSGRGRHGGDPCHPCLHKTAPALRRSFPVVSSGYNLTHLPFVPWQTRSTSARPCEHPECSCGLGGRWGRDREGSPPKHSSSSPVPGSGQGRHTSKEKGGAQACFLEGCVCL